MTRRRFNKLSWKRDDALAKFSVGVAVLSKSYDVMGSTVNDMQKRLDQAAEDVEFLQNFNPSAPIRRFHA